MSSSRKALKIISIIMIIFAIFLILFGLLMTLGFALVGDANSTTAVAGAVAGTLGIVFAVTGLVYILIGFLGIRGANDPQKIMPFYVLSIIGAVLGLLGLISNLVQGSFSPTSLIGLALVIACVVLAYNVKKEKDSLLMP